MTRDEARAVLTAPGAMFELEDVEVDGLSLRAYRNAPPTLCAVFQSTAQHADRDALVYQSERYTFAEQRRVVAGFAHVLQQRFGVKKGDSVAIASRNFPEFTFTFWATQVVGGLSVSLNAWWTTRELEYGVRDSTPTVLVVDSERWHRLEPIWRELPVQQWIVVRHDGPLPDGVLRWDGVMAEAPDTADLPDVTISPEDSATILYTSGTTGNPKGAVASHRNHCTNVMNTFYFGMHARTMAGIATAAAGASQPASLNPFPFFHIGGLSSMYINAATGSKLILMYRWDTEEALELCARERVTTLAMVPTLLRKMLESPALDKHDLSSLMGIASGAAPVPPDLSAKLNEKFDGRVIGTNGYGLTETTSGVCVNSGASYLARPHSVGTTFPINDIRIVDEAGLDVPLGAVGELWIRGSNIVKGYWRKPDETRAAFTDGWFHSGDLATQDDEGYITIVDRLKDVVIRGGENVYCVEVEAALFEHPAIDDVAVIGVAHRELGEEVCAIVVVNDDVSIDDLRAFAAERIAAFKVPSVWIVRTEPLPRTATGKVLKRELRDEVTA